MHSWVKVAMVEIEKVYTYYNYLNGNKFIQNTFWTNFLESTNNGNSDSVWILYFSRIHSQNSYTCTRYQQVPVYTWDIKQCCRGLTPDLGIAGSPGTYWLTCLLSERLIAFEWKEQTQNTFLMADRRQWWLISSPIEDKAHIFILFKNNMYS